MPVGLLVVRGLPSCIYDNHTMALGARTGLNFALDLANDEQESGTEPTQSNDIKKTARPLVEHNDTWLFVNCWCLPSKRFVIL